MTIFSTTLMGGVGDVVRETETDTFAGRDSDRHSRQLMSQATKAAIEERVTAGAREVSPSEDGAETDSERSHSGGPRRQDDGTAASEDPNPDGRRIPSDVCGRPCRHDPHGPTCRRIAV